MYIRCKVLSQGEKKILSRINQLLKDKNIIEEFNLDEKKDEETQIKDILNGVDLVFIPLRIENLGNKSSLA